MWIHSSLHYLWSQYPTEISNSKDHEPANWGGEFLYAPNGKQFNTGPTEGNNNISFYMIAGL